MVGNPRQQRPNLYRRISDNYKTETGRKTKSSQKMATNKSPSRQTTLQQNSERTKTPVTNHQKRGYPKLSPRTNANWSHGLFVVESHPQNKATSAPNTANTQKPQHVGTNRQTKSHSLRQTHRIDLPTVSIPTIGNRRRNH